MIKFLFTVLVILFLPLTVLGTELGGTGWSFEEDDGHKMIVLFDNNNTFTYLNINSPSGNTGKIFSGDNFEWNYQENGVFLSFNNNFQVCSLDLKSSSYMSGTCISELGGTVTQIKGRLIE